MLRFLCLAVVGSLASCVASSVFAADDVVGDAKPRNVLLLISDNQNRDDCGCYGNSQVKTPHIDKLAADGTKFKYGFATTASCGPSRAVIYTGLLTHGNGQYGHGHGYHTFVLKPKVQTVFSLLKDNGYRVALFGKQHTTPPSAYPFDNKTNVNARDVLKLAAAGEKFIRESGDTPFFLTIGYSDPHPTSRDGHGYGAKRKEAGYDPPRYDPATLKVPEYLPNRPWVREGLAGYYQQISRMDEGVGRILKALEDTGKADDTLVIFTSDHGSAEPGAMSNHYEPGVLVPFIVRNPDQNEKGTTTDAMATLADITPTILDWTKTAAPTSGLHGRSILSAVAKPDIDGFDEVFLSHVCHEVTMYYPMRTIRTKRYKLIWNIAWRLEYPNPIDTLDRSTWQHVINDKEKMIGQRSVQKFLFRDELELYDLQNDRHESRNLANYSDYADVRDKLLAKLKTKCEQTNDPWLLRHQVPTGKTYGRHLPTKKAGQ
ncbi:sulfatase [bacterium]|nr:sulfatase [bacterium]